MKINKSQWIREAVGFLGLDLSADSIKKYIQDKHGRLDIKSNLIYLELGNLRSRAKAAGLNPDTDLARVATDISKYPLPGSKPVSEPVNAKAYMVPKPDGSHVLTGNLIPELVCIIDELGTDRVWDILAAYSATKNLD